ncbi:hypothetical protein F5Y03DRAFT_342924 [Xylaria venustula]|nr:hypothetical protein F5Y03DRAFT_342924 [Xylaria venustula]
MIACLSSSALSSVVRAIIIILSVGNFGLLPSTFRTRVVGRQLPCAPLPGTCFVMHGSPQPSGAPPGSVLYVVSSRRFTCTDFMYRKIHPVHA